MEATRILSGIEGIGQITLTNKDVVRHPLVQKIILAYEKFENRKRGEQDGKKERRILINNRKQKKARKVMFAVAFLLTLLCTVSSSCT